MGIVHPQYWLQPNCDDSSTKHIKTLKAWYYEPKILGFRGSSLLVASLVDCWGLDA
jgi:hypothetical protein